ncbi:hypothetical protein GWK47_053432 [Chionoecetes opilio]|uniref:Endonuclease/exonuclease/phosphatase domain-containing protein n=1 Tax=Chionoecetes opilio TaxID=41210 RepID=A0A8J5CS89_CHIOP|nr:hypothetical protein GWK47_053432 [Chionoecetes opilio]
MEMMFFKLWTHTQDSILMCVCYRPQWQGGEPLHYLTTNLDTLLLQHSCKHLIIVGDLNQYLVQRQFDELLTVFGLTNHVDFPTHISGSSLDPVITDLPCSIVTCRPLATVGSSDHLAVLTKIKLAIDRDEAVTRTNWLWDKGDWDAMKATLNKIVWSDVLTGDVDTQVKNFTEILISHQRRFMPCQTYKSKPGDQPWFGFQCRKAADSKNKAWLRYKSHPTRRHKHQHKIACENMKRVQKEAINNWRDHLKRKLTGQSVGTKDWWSSIKQQQSFSRDDSIPPLTAPDGSVVTCHRGKAQVLAAHFSSKMTVPDPERELPTVPVLTKAALGNITITTEEEGRLRESQVRSLMEYSPLAWSSCPPSYLRLLDRVQARAQRLARLKAPEAAAQIIIIQPLQQRRDVAGMCVMYKAHRMQLLQLAELRLNPRARPSHSTRAAHNIDHQVTALREDGTLPPLLPTPLWSTLEHLGAPDRPAPHHFHARLQIGRKNAWLQAELT